MSMIATLLLLTSASTPIPVMDEVPQYWNQLIAAIPAGDGSANVLFVQSIPVLEVSRWAPRSGARIWSRTLPDRSRAIGAAICSIADQDGDGQDDWALVQGRVYEPSAPRTGVVTIGSGATGEIIRSAILEDVGVYVTVCDVRGARNGCDLVVGCPDARDGAGEVRWLRAADLTSCGRMAAPEKARAFGAFVGNLIPGDPSVWISAPESPGRWTIWRATSSAASSRSVLVQGERPEEEEPWRGDQTLRRRYGCWVSVSRTPGPLRDRTISVGATGRPMLGRVASWVVRDRNAAVWIDGPEQMWGTHFGEVVLVVEDLDGDGKPDTVVTDPGLHQVDDFAGDDVGGIPTPDRQYLGGIYLQLSTERTPRRMGMGETEWSFLGIGLVPVGDLDGDGFGEVAALAQPRHRDKEPYVEVWSVKDRSKLRTIRIRRSDAR